MFLFVINMLFYFLKSCRVLRSNSNHVTACSDVIGVPQEKMAALEAQANQLGVQATVECEKLAKDRTLILQMLHKVGLWALFTKRPSWF